MARDDFKNSQLLCKRTGHDGGHERRQQRQAFDDFADAVAVGFLANAADVCAYSGLADAQLLGHLRRGVTNANQAQDLLFGAGELVGAGEEAHHEGFAHTCARENEGDAAGGCGSGAWCICWMSRASGIALLPIQRHDGYRALRGSAQGKHAALALQGFGQRFEQGGCIGRLGGLQAMALLFEQVPTLQDHLAGQIAMLHLATPVYDDHAAGDFIERMGQKLPRFAGERERGALADVALLMR